MFAAFWILQGIALIYQNKKFQRKIKEMQSFGELYIGVHKSIFGNKLLTFISISNGEIIKAEYLRGLTIFAKFKILEMLINRKVDDVITDRKILENIKVDRKLYASLLNSIEKYYKHKKIANLRLEELISELEFDR